MTGLVPTDLGVFGLSPECDNDPVATQAMVERCGRDATTSLLSEAAEAPEPADSMLLRRIHEAWFGEPFPMYGGKFRTVDVRSRRPRVSSYHAVANDVAAAFFGFESDWVAAGGDRRQRRASTKSDLARLVVLANRITVRLHHVHPFIDGNTRSCLLLRRYLLQRAGFPPIPGDFNEVFARAAWDAADPVDHQQLDVLLYEEIAAAILEAG